jgi:hypothetical protein
MCVMLRLEYLRVYLCEFGNKSAFKLQTIIGHKWHVTSLLLQTTALVETIMKVRDSRRPHPTFLLNCHHKRKKVATKQDC